MAVMPDVLIQVLDHFEWRYLVAFDLAIANTIMAKKKDIKKLVSKWHPDETA